MFTVMTSAQTDETLPVYKATLPPLGSSGLVQAGFDDCSEEAVRYLTEVEGLSEDDPLVRGLKDHLKEQRRMLDVNQVLLDCEPHGFYHQPTFHQKVSNNQCGPVRGTSNSQNTMCSNNLSVENVNGVNNFKDGLTRVLNENSPEVLSLAQELLTLLGDDCSLIDYMDDSYEDMDDDDVDDDDDSIFLEESEQ